jgi:uncharacterized membrane protein YccF (DUF307 family)
VRPEPAENVRHGASEELVHGRVGAVVTVVAQVRRDPREVREGAGVQDTGDAGSFSGASALAPPQPSSAPVAERPAHSTIATPAEARTGASWQSRPQAPGVSVTVLVMRVLLNIIWFVFAGLWMALLYAVAALICFILIITIPFGVAALRIGIFALWPFGKTVVRRDDAGAGSALGNILWFVLCGWWLALGHLISGVLLCLTIIGIPLALADFKLIPVSLLPFGREIVSVEHARAMGLTPNVEVPVGRPTAS